MDPDAHENVQKIYSQENVHYKTCRHVDNIYGISYSPNNQ